MGTKRGSVGVVKKVRAEVERVVAVGGARWRGRAVGGEVGVGVAGLGWSRESVLMLPKILAAPTPTPGSTSNPWHQHRPHPRLFNLATRLL